MPEIEHVRAEIERMRFQVHRQRGEIKQLQRAGISTASAEALLDRMLDAVDRLCAERDRLKKEQPGPKGQSARWPPMVAPLKWYDANATDNPPFLKALAEVRKIGVHEGWCYHHVQAIMLSIDQYAEAATGNREFMYPTLWVKKRPE